MDENSIQIEKKILYMRTFFSTASCGCGCPCVRASLECLVTKRACGIIVILLKAMASELFGRHSKFPIFFREYLIFFSFPGKSFKIFLSLGEIINMSYKFIIIFSSEKIKLDSARTKFNNLQV